MLQGLAQFCVALPEFLEQANVLDRDHRLIGEGLKQLNLLIRKWTDVGSPNGDRADGYAFTLQRRGQE